MSDNFDHMIISNPSSGGSMVLIIIVVLLVILLCGSALAFKMHKAKKGNTTEVQSSEVEAVKVDDAPIVIAP